MLFYFSKFINFYYGINFISLKEKKMRLSHSVKKNNNLTNFLRVGFKDNAKKILFMIIKIAQCKEFLKTQMVFG